MNKLIYLTFVLFSLKVTAQNVYIPDPNFKAALTGNAAINTNGNNEIEISEANSYNGSIAAQSLNISNLTGIEEFTSATHFYLEYNNISSADFSQNTSAVLIDIRQNQLTSITLGSTNLSSLTIWDNSLTSLDVSGLSNLTNLSCSQNLLTGIDLTNNPILSNLDCADNSITAIDLTQNSQLTDLWISNNQLSQIDVSGNPLLLGFDCTGNTIGSIDLSNNPNLEEFYCGGNQITTLDISSIANLGYFDCSNNLYLTSLNAANGNNTLMSAAFSFYAINTPNLTCIQVDDAAWAAANWTNIDSASSFNENCPSVASLPEVEFETLVTPNPANEIVNVESTKPVEQILLKDLSGKIIMTDQYNQINVSHIPTGTYILEVRTKNNISVHKLIKR